MNKPQTPAAPLAPVVGRVSPSGRNPTNHVQARKDVGLRDETANPTYGAGRANGDRSRTRCFDPAEAGRAGV